MALSGGQIQIALGVEMGKALNSGIFEILNIYGMKYAGLGLTPMQ